MPRECLSDVALGQRYCLRGSQAEKLLHSLQGFKGKRLRAGKRQDIKGFKGFEGF